MVVIVTAVALLWSVDVNCCFSVGYDITVCANLGDTGTGGKIQYIHSTFG